MSEQFEGELEVVKGIHTLLRPLKPARRAVVLRMVVEQQRASLPAVSQADGDTRTDDADFGQMIATTSTVIRKRSPKDWFAEKRPIKGNQRMACLGYYLTRFENTDTFKTKDLTTLNTRAAQPKFSSAAVFARDAIKAGYFAPAGGGKRQVTTLGDLVVEALPDQAKVREVLQQNAHTRQKSGRRRRV
ncbi:MAG TPA: hypothetical protein VFB49_10145 [Patescibacteria group bacterium]|nr:hypothetical protein [Patescibacteria group bacterium]